MQRDVEAIDADGHITETDNQLREYMELPYQSRGATLYPQDYWDRSVSGTLGVEASDARTWLDALDRGGISTAVLFPTNGLGIGWIREPDYAVALCKAWNNFVTEKFQKVSPRLKAVALIPMQDVNEAIKELRRAVSELKLAGAMLPAVGLRAPLSHPQFDPIWAEAERSGCMMAVHATVRGPHAFGADGFDSFIEVHTLSHPFAQMTQLTGIIFRGIPERFPRVKIAFMESGCSWVPFWMDRMDEEWEKRGAVEAPHCKKKPSEYVTNGQLFFHAEADEKSIAEAVRRLGDGVLFYASDFPHWDHSFPHSLDEMIERKDLSEETRRKILFENARRLYGLAPASA